jgi:diaminohydroxyphosphoribosylaminopyrimidine deaminase/5-amino-6-(5-phosphoribosylamino)uracil reductase
MTNENYIQRTFELAKRGLGKTWPNPLVGAVIVKNGKIIGEGYHKRHGLDHAEVDAIKNCTESPEGATIFVNLEPCCHTNKNTPPCAQRLIQEKIKKVVICNLDPNPHVNGQGIQLLKENGIEVEYGILSELGEKLNEVFFFSQRNRAPFLHLKLASTLDGKISLPNGESKWITGPMAREYVHEMRSQHQAIIAGAETIRKDNPKLNVRLPDFTGEQPLRLIFTKSGRLPSEAQVFTDEIKNRTIIFSQNVIKFSHPSENIVLINNLSDALNYLYEKKVISLFLEGGSSLATSFLSQGLINRLSLFLNPSLLGHGQNSLGDLGIEQLDQRPKLKDLESRWIDGDLLITGRIK